MVPRCTSAKSARRVQSVLHNDSLTLVFHGESKVWLWTFFHARKAAMHSHKGLNAKRRDARSSGCSLILTSREKAKPVPFFNMDCLANCAETRLWSPGSNCSTEPAIWISQSKVLMDHACFADHEPILFSYKRGSKVLSIHSRICDFFLFSARLYFKVPRFNCLLVSRADRLPCLLRPNHRY